MDYTRQGRAVDALRTVKITPNFLQSPEGSALIEFGNTKVICTATVEDTVPPFLRGKEQGWITAEYGMLPRSTGVRMKREAASGKQGGRTVEIQRLIGRSLRAACDLTKLGERQIIIDCDVIQADGGTRCASITGGFVALSLAINKLLADNKLAENPLIAQIAAVSVGVVGGVPLLDLDYIEDSGCDSDMNVIMSNNGKIVEIQGTAEGAAFGTQELTQLLGLAQKGINDLFLIQKQAIQATWNKNKKRRRVGNSLPTRFHHIFRLPETKFKRITCSKLDFAGVFENKKKACFERSTH